MSEIIRVIFALIIVYGIFFAVVRSIQWGAENFLDMARDQPPGWRKVVLLILGVIAVVVFFLLVNVILPLATQATP